MTTWATIALSLDVDNWIAMGKRVANGVGLTDDERLSGMTVRQWRALREALCEAGWLENPTGHSWALTPQGLAQFERLSIGDLWPIARWQITIGGDV